MTILFNDWTFDMPSGLLNNYRDFTIRYENMYMIVHYWVEDDPPPEGIYSVFSLRYIFYIKGVKSLKCTSAIYKKSLIKQQFQALLLK